ncbi:helix-turn-helix domain-containing protein [Paenibacillus ginsengihumi]|uniref:helix-turn-helix domain-containing protein n=1 Tax=Paenibacillus ginsengihumi TaxID=431596 RepID=UPI00037AD51C|nr:AraC family transcriptional regulator [Paenibacillus ginsengihumi]
MIVKRWSDYARGGAPLWIQRAAHQAYDNPPMHRHEFYELVYVVHGTGVHLVGDRRHPLLAGSVFVVHPGEPHQYLLGSGDSLEIVNCMFRRECLVSSLPPDPTLAGLAYLAPIYDGAARFPPALQLDSEESSALLGLLEDILREMRLGLPGYAVAARNKLAEVLILLSRYAAAPQAENEAVPRSAAANGHEITARRMRAYLERHFSQKITLATLSLRFNMSERHINRIFKHETGKSVTETLQHIRIERARQLLRETSRSIEAVATAVGFGDASFFSRLFLRQVGCTPGQYRKQHRRLTPVPERAADQATQREAAAAVRRG